MDKKCVLIVEEDEALRALVGDVLESTGFRALTAGSMEKALEILKGEATVHLCFLDLSFHRLNDHDLHAELGRLVHGKGFALVLTSFHHDLKIQCAVCRASAHLHKPYDLDELVRAAWKFSQGAP